MDMDVSSEEERRPMFKGGIDIIFEDMGTKAESTLPKLHPFRTAKYKKIKAVYKDLDPELKRIWHALFARVKDKRSRDEEISLEAVLGLPNQKSQTMPSCGKVLDEGQTIYRCFDCGNHVSTVVCKKCFEEGDHRGHRYEAVPSLGGTCDCGNGDSLKPQGFCHRHSGKVTKPKISWQERRRFFKINTTLYEWFLVLYARDDQQSINLLNNQILYLDKLNTQSLYYNWLTYEWLKQRISTGELVVEHLLKLGPKHSDLNFDKWATELILKLFVFEEAKYLLAEHYLTIYNSTMRFETSQFKNLFIQMFSHYKIIKATIEKTRCSLEPKNRKDEYDICEYYHQLMFVDSLDSESARIFYRPIIKNGGLDYANMRYIWENIDKSYIKIEDFYVRKRHEQNAYYQVLKAMGKHFYGCQQDLAQAIANEVKMTHAYKFQKNQAVIPHHRSVALYTFIYFNCDFDNIDPKALMRILKKDQQMFLQEVKSLLRRYLACFRQFSRSLGHRQYDNYVFDSYLPLYVKIDIGCKVFIFDCLGLKIFGGVLAKMGKEQIMRQLLLEVFMEEKDSVQRDINWVNNDLNAMKYRMSQEKDMMRRHLRDRRKNAPGSMVEEQEDFDIFEHEYMFRRHMMGRQEGPRNPREFMAQSQQKITRLNVTFFAQCIHFIFLIMEMVHIERPEIMLANDCHIRTPKVVEMNKDQLIQILSNAEQISSNEMQNIITYFFGDIDRDIISKVANYDTQRRVYKIKPDMRGVPICKDLLHSFIDIETCIKETQNGVKANNKTKILQKIFLSQQILGFFLDNLIQHFNDKITQKRLTLLRYLAGLVKRIGLCYGFRSEFFLSYYKKVLKLAEKQKAEEQIRMVIQLPGQLSSQPDNDELDRKRMQENRLRQKLKLKEKTSNQSANIQKVIEGNSQQGPRKMQNEAECIVCRGSQDLLYMGSYGESSFIFNTLGLKGNYLFFNCCFHPIHHHCLLQTSKGKQQAQCPFCSAHCNLLFPTEANLKSEHIYKQFTEQLETIPTAIGNKKTSECLTVRLIKSFIQLFFVFVMQKRPINPKKIKIYQLLLEIIKIRFSRANQIEQQQIHEELQNSHKVYSRLEGLQFALDQFISVVNFCIKRAIVSQRIEADSLRGLSRKIASQDVEKLIGLAKQIFDIAYSPGRNIVSAKQLSFLVKLYKPPMSMKDLRKIRVQKESKCKSGHNICCCVVCSWVGCADCGNAAVHALDDHCNQAIFFNFISGGLIYITRGSKFSLPCLYLNYRTGEKWTPDKKDEDFTLDYKSYDDMLNMLAEENVSDFISQFARKSQLSVLN